MALQEDGEGRGDRLPRRREDLETLRTGWMGSTFYRWRFAPTDLAGVLEYDWSQMGRRVFVDPEQGEVTLMAPSWAHQEMSRYVFRLVESAATALSISIAGGGGTTWSPPDFRRVEADESFYLGEAAVQLRDAKRERQAGIVDAFVSANPPQLVIEVERTRGDAGKPDIYRALGVAEMWRIDRSRDQALSVAILELQSPGDWRAVDSSGVLPGLTPELIARTLEAADIDGASVISDLLATAGIGR